MLKVKLPATVGVPDRVPLLPSVTPAGSAPLPSVKFNGLTPPVAMNVCANGAAAVPPGSDAGKTEITDEGTSSVKFCVIAKGAPVPLAPLSVAVTEKL